MICRKLYINGSLIGWDDDANWRTSRSFTTNVGTEGKIVIAVRAGDEILTDGMESLNIMRSLTIRMRKYILR